VTATWANIPNPTSTDWLGLYAQNTPDQALLAYRYADGTATNGTGLPLTVPSTLTSGSYELRLFSNNSSQRLAVSNGFSVTAPSATSTPTASATSTATATATASSTRTPTATATPPTSLSATPPQVAAGATVTATWANVPSPSSTDWLGLYPQSVPVADSNYLAFRYTTGTASGSVPVALPSTLAAGSYELRLFSNNSFQRLATSNAFTVVALTATPTPTATATSAATSTATRTLTVTATATAYPRPNLGVQTAPEATGRLRVTLSARDAGCGANNQLFAVRFGTATNAQLDLGDGVLRAGNFHYALPSPAAQVSFTVVRQTAGQASTVSLEAVDGCGAWPTFVGGGPGAF
jgi:hypothetical protein